MEPRLVLITGASRGLGLATADRLLNDGYRVVSVSRGSTTEMDALIEKYPRQCYFMQLDLSATQQIYGFLQQVTQRHGPLYGLINNAAVGYDGLLATMHETQINELIRVNVEAPILLAKYCSRSMLLQQRGRIVNISSIIADTGFSGLSVYAASKAALVGLTKSLARELGKARITVNAVAPGYMETDMTKSLTGERLDIIRRRSPLGQLATVSDVSAAIAFLLSDDAARITGITLTVDAGSTA